MNTLHLTLHRQWFDAILRGEKTEEYREIKPYWTNRLKMGYHFELVEFRNGYSKGSPVMEVECKGIFTGHGVMAQGAPKESCYIIKLGRVLNVSRTH